MHRSYNEILKLDHRTLEVLLKSD